MHLIFTLFDIKPMYCQEMSSRVTEYNRKKTSKKIVFFFIRKFRLSKSYGIDYQ